MKTNSYLRNFSKKIQNATDCAIDGNRKNGENILENTNKNKHSTQASGTNLNFDADRIKIKDFYPRRKSEFVHEFLYFPSTFQVYDQDYRTIWKLYIPCGIICSYTVVLSGICLLFLLI